MSQLHDQLEQMREHTTSAWDDEAIELALRGVTSRRRARRRAAMVKLAAATTLLLLVTLGALALLRPDATTTPTLSPPHLASETRESPHRDDLPRQELPPEPKLPDPLLLADTTLITPLTPDTAVDVNREQEAQTVVTMTHGKAHYRVAKRPERTFRVDLPTGTFIEVLGTTFTVEASATEVRIELEEGKIRVQAPDEEAVLLLAPASHVILLKPRQQADRPPLEVTPVSPQSEERRPPEQAHDAPRHDLSTWRRLVRDRDYDAAYEQLPARSALRSADDLMLAADVMRFTGRYAEARELFELVVTRHPRTSRAGAAQFEIGRLLERQRDMRAAAEAFARVDTLKANRATAEDALVRQIRAWHYAGESGRARAQAQRYLELYPDGYRVDEVRRYGGLDDASPTP